jgi:hypothetical protein
MRHIQAYIAIEILGEHQYWNHLLLLGTLLLFGGGNSEALQLVIAQRSHSDSHCRKDT